MGKAVIDDTFVEAFAGIFSRVIVTADDLETLTAAANDSTATPAFKEKTIAAFKNQITSKLYWRYRQYALGSLRKILATPYNNETIEMLLNLIKIEKSWLKASAIFTLGNTNDEKYLDIYIEALNDESDRVINAAAIAIGKTKSLKAFSILLDCLLFFCF